MRQLSSISGQKQRKTLFFMAAMLAVAIPAWLSATDASADLLVSSTTNDVVRRYNATTGAFIDNFASGGGLDGPLGLVYGPDSNLYVSSNPSDNVKRYNGTTGAFMDTFASGGGLDGPRGLVFGPDGNLYVTSAVNDQVRRYNGTTGAFMDTFVFGGSASGGANGGLNSP